MHSSVLCTVYNTGQLHHELEPCKARAEHSIHHDIKSADSLAHPGTKLEIWNNTSMPDSHIVSHVVTCTHSF